MILKLQQTWLSAAVDDCAVSGVEGIRKPDVGLFDVAAKLCGVPLTEGGWMIGDSLTVDIGGGRAAGMHTIWMHREPRHSHEDQADHVATDVTEAIRLMRQETR